MAVNIKNDGAEEPSRQVAAGTGESRMAAIHAPGLEETLMAISRQCSSLPDLDVRSAEEILGYDEKGEP